MWLEAFINIHLAASTDEMWVKLWSKQVKLIISLDTHYTLATKNNQTSEFSQYKIHFNPSVNIVIDDTWCRRKS